MDLINETCSLLRQLLTSAVDGLIIGTSLYILHIACENKEKGRRHVLVSTHGNEGWPSDDTILLSCFTETIIRVYKGHVGLNLVLKMPLKTLHIYLRVLSSNLHIKCGEKRWYINLYLSMKWL